LQKLYETTLGKLEPFVKIQVYVFIILAQLSKNLKQMKNKRSIKHDELAFQPKRR